MKMLSRRWLLGAATLAIVAAAAMGSQALASGIRAGGAAVGVAKSPLGRILVDGKGITLYDFVQDKGTIHDFHLIGPGVNKVVTSVPFTGTKTVMVKLKKGKYIYQCDPHAASGMKGSFKVT